MCVCGGGGGGGGGRWTPAEYEVKEQALIAEARRSVRENFSSGDKVFRRSEIR